MNKEELIEIIKEKINWKECFDCKNNQFYDGFDMSGFGDTFWHNQKLIARFSEYMTYLERDPKTYTVVFWKGSGRIVRIGFGYSEESSTFLEEELSGYTTIDILLKLITLSNPKLIDK